MIFRYHTLYTLDQIETASGQSATRSPGITHLPNQASVRGPDGEQYDFCGHDDDHLILLWINDERMIDRRADATSRLKFVSRFAVTGAAQARTLDGTA